MAEPLWHRGANAGELLTVERIDAKIAMYREWIAEERRVRRMILADCRRRAGKMGRTDG